MNHKRRKPKSARAGCALCKPHKQAGTSPLKAAKPSDQRRMGLRELSRLTQEFGGYDAEDAAYSAARRAWRENV